MIHASTVNKLNEMRLTAMADAFRQQLQDSTFEPLSFEERFSLIVDIEWASSYDLIREKEATYVINGLNQYYFKGDDNMKFDVVVGNPPYQDEHVGNNNQAPPIFNLFYDLAEKMAPKYCLISPARFLANQGATPKAWNNKMLNDDHLKIESDELTKELNELRDKIQKIRNLLQKKERPR